MSKKKGNKTSLPVEVRSRDGKRDKKPIKTKQLNIRNKEVDRMAKQTPNFEWLGMEVNREISREAKNPSDRQLYRAASEVNKQNIANSPSEQEFYNWVKRVERNDREQALRRKEKHANKPYKKKKEKKAYSNTTRKAKYKD